MIRVLVIEPHETGHHATYLRWTIEAIVDRGWVAVVATTPHALAHPEMRFVVDARNVIVREIHDIAPVTIAASRLGILRNEWRYWWRFRALVVDELRAGPLSAVVYPYLDYLFFAAGLLTAPTAGVPWCGISMRLWYEPTRDDAPPPLRWRLARRLLGDARCRALFCINPSIVGIPAHWLDDARRARLRYLPDPADPPPPRERTASRAALGLTDSSLAVLVYGAISTRKGVLELAAALSGDSRLSNYVLVVAGRVSADMRPHFSAGSLVELEREGRLKWIDRTVDDGEQAELFAAADVVWLGYVGHAGTSGVLVLAGVAGLPVIACDYGEIGLQVRRHDLGEAVNVSNPLAVRAALARLGERTRRATCGANGRRAFANHGSADFKRTLTEAIQPLAVAR